MRNAQFVEKTMAYAKFGACMQAGVSAFVDGPNVSLAALKNNGDWGVLPWPGERLEQVCNDGVAHIKVLTDDKPERARYAAAHIIGAAIADVLGVPQP